MKRSILALMLAQILCLPVLAGYVAFNMARPALLAGAMIPLEPPMSRLAGLAP